MSKFDKVNPGDEVYVKEQGRGIFLSYKPTNFLGQTVRVKLHTEKEPRWFNEKKVNTDPDTEDLYI